MSAERTAEEWGRVAVSLPGAIECWRDLEGVDGHDAPGAICADGTWWSPDSAEGMFLDVDHPATAGCLLALLGPKVLVRCLPREGRPVVEVVIPGSMTADGRPWRESGTSLGRACIAAAEAIGRWPA